MAEWKAIAKSAKFKFSGVMLQMLVHIIRFKGSRKMLQLFETS